MIIYSDACYTYAVFPCSPNYNVESIICNSYMYNLSELSNEASGRPVLPLSRETFSTDIVMIMTTMILMVGHSCKIGNTPNFGWEK